ncbi:MAG: dihydrodipicolinate synthase family protein [Rhodospirillales bacterium]|jgi:dihydrodipicolinate synthase/N-acetylneuraminate lyase|nr:dihydrodipicolinate synthase family protein [Rhodospirillales bacterium]MDP6885189.1 dihydrodipicolinate synthase family protein [Rhodospirillales bacterium]
MTTIPVGRYPAPVAPFSAQGDFMPDAFTELLRYFIDNGAKGLLIAGDNAEAWSLSPDEIAQMTRLAMDAAQGKPVYVSAWAITERETVERARAAADAGAYGLCVKPPHYIHSWADAPADAIVRRFEVVAKAVPLPMMVYNSPNRTNVSITPDVLESICGVAEVEALKDTNHDAGHLLENVLRFHDRMAVLVSGPAFIPAMMMGAGGTIGTGMDLFADADRMFDFAEMTPEESRALQRKIFDVSRVINTTGTIPAAYKAAFNMLGLPGGHLREPVPALTPAEEAAVRDLLVCYGALDGAAAERAAS